MALSPFNRSQGAFPFFTKPLICRQRIFAHGSYTKVTKTTSQGPHWA